MGKFLRVGCWNVNGLTSKLSDSDFLHHIKGYDLLCMQETKCNNDKVF